MKLLFLVFLAVFIILFIFNLFYLIRIEAKVKLTNSTGLSYVQN